MSEALTSATTAKAHRKASSGNGKKSIPSKPAKAPRAAPLTLAEIEHLAGPIDFSVIYKRVDEPVRIKLSIMDKILSILNTVVPGKRRISWPRGCQT